MPVRFDRILELLLFSKRVAFSNYDKNKRTVLLPYRYSYTSPVLYIVMPVVVSKYRLAEIVDRDARKSWNHDYRDLRNFDCRACAVIFGRCHGFASRL